MAETKAKRKPVRKRVAAKEKTAARTVTIMQVRSGISSNFRHKRTLRALGLRRPNQKVVRPDNEAIRGMVGSIPHLVRILEG